MAVPSFLFGGSTNETPQSIKQKRDLVRALMGASNSPKNIGEGLNALGDGIVANVLDRRANAAEAAGQSAANSLFNSILGNSSASPSATGSAIPTTSPSGNAAISSQPGEVYNPFIDTVKTGYDAGNGQKIAVTNPYGLAAVAATGQAESSFSPQNANRTWSDPSESGKAGTAGGIMSWRGPRLAALQQFAQANGEQPGNISPQTQAKFFLQEDPNLVASLNNAKSVEEAQQLMNRAWAFRGYDRPGGEAARRMGLASGFLPKFQGQGGGQEVASLDPSAGMPQTASQAIDTAAPPSGYVDPMVTTASRPPMAASTAMPQRAPLQGPPRPAPQLPAPTTIANAPSVSAVPPQQAPRPVQVAQNSPFGGVDPRLLQALQNPWLNEGQKAAVQLLIQQQQQAAQQASEEQTWKAREDYKLAQEKADPSYQLEQDYKRAQLEALKAKTGKRSNVTNLGDGWLYDNDTHEAFRPQDEVKKAGGTGFRFGGNSVEAQALNGLIESGQITEGQAQQLGAGKTISGPNGEMLFLTPQGIFKQDGQQGGAQQQGVDLFGERAPQQQAQSVDLFGEDASTPRPIIAGGVGQPAPANTPIQITAPKAPSNEQLNAAGFADRMHSAGQILDANEQQGLNGWDQFLTRSPFVPSIVGNSIVGNTNPDYQVFDQAKRDFINAQLRRESGAVIGKDEFDNADKQYFPQPGDSADVIKQKRDARQLAIESMGRSAGPNYKRPESKPQESADIKAAREAIAKGAPRDKVIKRLQDAGIDTTGL